MHWFQSISSIWQSSTHNDGHRILATTTSTTIRSITLSMPAEISLTARYDSDASVTISRSSTVYPFPSWIEISSIGIEISTGSPPVPQSLRWHVKLLGWSRNVVFVASGAEIVHRREWTIAAFRTEAAFWTAEWDAVVSFLPDESENAKNSTSTSLPTHARAQQGQQLFVEGCHIIFAPRLCCRRRSVPGFFSTYAPALPLRIIPS